MLFTELSVLFYTYFAMDKRQIKTRISLYHAFGECLKEKDYAEISVEDILHQSGVSRSTFYAHFKGKDDLLESISRNIFAHVFSHSLKQESTHDFSSDSLFEYKHLFTHIFYHLRDDKELIKTILSSSCREVFLEELRKGIGPLVEKVVKDGIVPSDDIPLPLAILQTRERFVISFVYWFGNDCKESPETMTSYLFFK